MSIVVSTKFGPIKLSEPSLSMGNGNDLARSFLHWGPFTALVTVHLSGNVEFSRDFDDADAKLGIAAVMRREVARQLAERFEAISNSEQERADRERERDGQANAVRQEVAL
jgi:hypothetical protein